MSRRALPVLLLLWSQLLLVWPHVVLAGPTTRVSVGPGGVQANGRSSGPSVSGDSVLVRSINGAHVFRGVGALDGLPPPEPTH